MTKDVTAYAFEQTRLVDADSDRLAADVEVHSLLSKLRRRVLPSCVVILVFCNIDKGNLGFVANQLCRDLNLSHTEYGTGASAFFAGFFFSRIPSNLALRHFGGPFWLAVIMCTWGILAAALAFINRPYQFYLLRFLLGTAEGGAFPGVWYYLAGFFPDAHLTYAYTIIALALPIAMVVSGPLAVMFLTMDGLFGIAAWRHLFFVEGMVPALVAPLLYLYLPQNIDAPGLVTSEERAWLRRELGVQTAPPDRSLKEELVNILRNGPFWVLTLTGILRQALFAVIMYWTALMIEIVLADSSEKDMASCASSHSTAMGSTVATAGVFTLAAVMVLVVGIAWRNSRNRGRVAGWVTTVSGASFGLWGTMEKLQRGLGLITLTISAATIHSDSSLIVALLVSFFDLETKSTALSMYATIDSLGAVLGPVLAGTLVDSSGGYALAGIVIGTLGVVGGLPMIAIRDPLSLPHDEGIELAQCQTF